jgi:hydroxyacylglutathione hydrolase
MQWYPIRALQDNYIWASQSQSNQIVVVDPGESEPVFQYLFAHQLTLSAIWITHHHADHTGGVMALCRRYDVPVYGPKTSYFKAITHPVSEGDQVKLSFLDSDFKVLSVPAHTLDHIAFLGGGAVFSGDTLFSAGCGRVFEGKMEQMYQALQRFASLPSETRVYCGHEYTLANLRFARMVLPEDEALRVHEHRLTQLYEQNSTTLPSTIAEERAMNLFLRLSDPTLCAALAAYAKRPIEDELDAFITLRKWKDQC